MAKILVTSNGISKRTPVIDELFTTYCAGKKVCVIANAANINSNNFVNREVVKRNLISVGAVAVDVVNLNIVTINTLLRYDVLYIMGGKPEDLNRAFREVNTKEVLTKFLEQGVIITEGEGTIALVDNFKYYYEINGKLNLMPDNETYEGLGFIKYKVYPHFNLLGDLLKRKIADYNFEHTNSIITRIADGEYIEIDDFEQSLELTMTYSENGEKTYCNDNILSIKEKGLYYGLVGMWIINSKGQVLLQKRSANKKSNPNMWAMCAGHIQTCETYEEAVIRETREEVGLRLENKDFKPLIDLTARPKLYKGYYTLCDWAIQNFKRQESEVSELKWIDFETFKAMYKKGDETIVFKKSETSDAEFRKLGRIVAKLKTK